MEELREIAFDAEEEDEDEDRERKNEDSSDLEDEETDTEDAENTRVVNETEDNAATDDASE